MLDIETGEQAEALYKMIQICGGKRIEKFRTTDINTAIKYQRWYSKRYNEGLLMQILPKKKIYNWKEKFISYSFE